jgi:hypothetical protein
VRDVAQLHAVSVRRTRASDSILALSIGTHAAGPATLERMKPPERSLGTRAPALAGQMDEDCIYLETGGSATLIYREQ